MHIVIAPNAFKNALSAGDAAKYIFEGLTKSKLKFTSTIFPVADGGDGTGALLIEKANASLINVIVKDPLGRKINATFGLTDDGVAIIELANACGLRLMKPDELDPLHASTFGAGELIKIALDKKAKRILFCVGGSATIDGGTGILQALGVTFLDIHGSELNGMPESLVQLAAINFSQLDMRIKNTELIILCDVENRLLGEKGAAAVFGRQKGATKNDVEKLEASLIKLKEIAFNLIGKDMSTIRYGGAAGGVAAGLSVFLNAHLVSGADYFLDYTNFDAALLNTDLIITGEGSIDEQTLDGKAPFAVAKRGKEKGTSVIGLAGKVPIVVSDKMKYYFDELIGINDEPFEIETALKNTANNLMCTAKKTGDALT